MKPGNGLDKQPVGGNQPAQTSTATPGLQNAPEGKPEAAGQFAQRGKKSVSVDNSRILVMLVGFALVLLLCAYAMVRSHEAASAPGSTTKKTGAQSKPADSNAGNEHHFLPTTNAAQSGEPDGDDGYATSKTVEQTATNHPNAVTTAAPPPPNTGGGTLASVPPFTAGQSWEPPPYQPGAQGAMPDGVALDAKAEREAMDKASLVFVRSASSSAAKSDAAPLMVEPELGLGLPPAAKLRARLESAVNTAVETPVTAVIEYNYERNGEIGGSKGNRAPAASGPLRLCGHPVRFAGLARRIDHGNRGNCDRSGHARAEGKGGRQEHGQEYSGAIGFGNRRGSRDAGRPEWCESAAERGGHVA